MGPFSPSTTILIFIGALVFILLLNLGLFAMARKKGNESENLMSTFRRVGHAARSPFEKEDKMIAELHRRVTDLQQPRKPEDKPQ